MIHSDHDGLTTDLFARASGSAISDAERVGQSFVARGVNLISAAFWLADPSGPTYAVRVFADGPGGAPVGTEKRNRPARLSADPEMIVAWSPGECPLTPGRTYYLEVTRVGGGRFYQTHVNRSDPFPYGQAYRDDTPLDGVDLAGTIIEETSPGSATLPAVRLLNGPQVAESDRGPHALTVRWSTSVAGDSQVEFGPNQPPYTALAHDTNLVTDHVVTLDGLRSHTLYHYRVTSAGPGLRPAVSRDLLAATLPRLPNLLTNGGFEAGSGPSPRKTIPGWTKTGSLDMGMSDGTWFGELKPRSGQWLFQGALNGSESLGHLYQRVRVIPGRRYTLTAWVYTKALERINNQTVEKYDAWNSRDRLIHVRLGIDPTGGLSPTSGSVRWTPRFYSHLHYSPAGTTTAATGDTLTVFLEFRGKGVEWHLYGVDDLVLTEDEPDPPRLSDLRREPSGGVAFEVASEAGRPHRVEVSTDLQGWSEWAQITPDTASFTVYDADPGPATTRFYRVVLP